MHDLLNSPMHSAFVLMNAELGKETQIVNELKKVSHVKEVYPVYGVYGYRVRFNGSVTGNYYEQS